MAGLSWPLSGTGGLFLRAHFTLFRATPMLMTFTNLLAMCIVTPTIEHFSHYV